MVNKLQSRSSPKSGWLNTAVFMAPSFHLAAKRVAQKGNNPFRSEKSPIKYQMNDQAPNSSDELGLVSKSKKISPVKTLII